MQDIEYKWKELSQCCTVAVANSPIPIYLFNFLFILFLIYLFLYMFQLHFYLLIRLNQSKLIAAVIAIERVQSTE